MKLERLQKILEGRARVKVFVLTDQFCLCGVASHPHEAGDALRVRVGASVRFVLRSGEVIDEPTSSGTLLLTASDKVTRRLQTHRRHLAEIDVPEDYFERALAL